MLREIEWRLQNRPNTKNGVLPVTTLFFRKFGFSLRTSYERVDLLYRQPKCPGYSKCAGGYFKQLAA